MNIEIKELVLDIYVLLLVLSCLYVPWEIYDGLDWNFLGYAFVWTQPRNLIDYKPFNVQINWYRLLLEFILFTLGAAVFYIIAVIIEKNRIKKQEIK